jgi:hypothetical protein
MIATPSTVSNFQSPLKTEIEPKDENLNLSGEHEDEKRNTIQITQSGKLFERKDSSKFLV